MTSPAQQLPVPAISQGSSGRGGGRYFAFAADVPVSLVVGRSLAVICHPQLAWHRLPPAGRAALAIGYGVGSYLSALVTLFVLRG
jgi:hypothetical protein